MQQFQVFKDIHKGVPTLNNTTQVNPIPVDYTDYVIGMQFTDYIYKAKDEGGCLWSPKPDIQIPTWANHFAYNRRVQYLSPETLAQDEYDWKFTLNAGQINLSTQVNFKNAGGAFQWDPNNPPKWANTGFTPRLNMDQPNDFMVRCSTDFSTWSLDAIAVNEVQFIPSLPRVPLASSSWTKQMAHNQEQAEVAGGGYTMKRYFKTELILSDGPIPLIWFT